MGSKKDVKVACFIAVILFFVGVVCYAKYPVQQPDEPVRVVYKSLAGDVVFDHGQHAENYDCTVCHHHGETDEFMACDKCHGAKTPAVVPSVCAGCHPLSEDDQDAYAEHHAVLEDEPGQWACKDCHQLGKDGQVPVSCSQCHETDPDESNPIDFKKAVKPMNFLKLNDAVHKQCIGCHEDEGSGPVECSGCHAQ